MATAQLYIKRFYCKVEIRRTNPYLVIATALYLACKMEECPQHIRIVVQEARSLWQGESEAIDPQHAIRYTIGHMANRSTATQICSPSTSGASASASSS